MLPFNLWGNKNPKEGACKSAADCQPDECCVHSPFAKRLLLDGNDFFSGFSDHFSKINDHFNSLM